MKLLTLLRRLILITAIFAPLSLTTLAAHAQQGTTIKGSFVIESSVGGRGIPVEMSFDPNGGPVTFPIMDDTFTFGFDDAPDCYGEAHISMDGTFAGGDGGAASGTIHATNTLDHAKSKNSCQGDEVEEDGTWSGKFNADGTGSGTGSMAGGGTVVAFTWEATYSAQEFQAALGAPPAEATQPAIATEEILPTEPALATEEPFEQPTAQPVEETAPTAEEPSGALSTIMGLGLLGAGGVAGIGGLGLLANTLLKGGSSSFASTANTAAVSATEAADMPASEPPPEADAPAPPLEDPAAELDTYPVPSDSHLQIGRNIVKNLPPRILGMLTRSGWKKLDDKERQQVIKYVVWQMGKQMGVGKIKMLWEMPKGQGYTDADEAKNYAGQTFFNKIPPEIFINIKNKSNWDIPAQLLDTLGHEVRHMQQYLPGHSLENEQLNRLSTYNKEHYIKYDENNPDPNLDQFVERDARSMGKNAGEEISKEAYRQKLNELGEFYKSTMQRGGPREVPRSKLDDLLANKPDSYRKRVGELITEGKLKVLDY